MSDGQINLPTTPAMQACYDRLKRETPALWQSFESKLLARASAGGPPDQRLSAVVAQARELWEEFLSTDDERQARSVKSAWNCCLGDLAEALAEMAIGEIAASAEAVERKRERLDAMLRLSRQELSDAPNSPGITMSLISAIQGLGASDA